VLIEATVRVAKSLRMGTVAEGIETAGQDLVVRSLGCEKGQGYLFSKPLLAAELLLWLAGEDEPGSAPDADVGVMPATVSAQAAGRA
jgi:EAL domain-containing protein (putative c-di-GMP-specific phosphodiesterase class I)